MARWTITVALYKVPSGDQAVPVEVHSPKELPRGGNPPTRLWRWRCAGGAVSLLWLLRRQLSVLRRTIVADSQRLKLLQGVDGFVEPVALRRCHVLRLVWVYLHVECGDVTVDRGCSGFVSSFRGDACAAASAASASSSTTDFCLRMLWYTWENSSLEALVLAVSGNVSSMSATIALLVRYRVLLDKLAGLRSLLLLLLGCADVESVNDEHDDDQPHNVHEEYQVGVIERHVANTAAAVLI